MAEQTFRSPGFFDQEIDLSGRVVTSTGIPAGVVGTAQKGPAFVPVTVGSFADFETKFGTLDPKMFGPYAVEKWLNNRTACTYVRVLGAGANETSGDIGNTRSVGTVTNAGFTVTGSLATQASGDGADGTATINVVRTTNGSVQLICARHNAATNEAAGFPIFTDNDSVSDANTINLVRGVVLLASGTRMLATSHNGQMSMLSGTNSTVATVGSIAGSALSSNKYFKLILSSTAGKSWANDEGYPGIKILTASLDPADGAYISRVLNTDPQLFGKEQHVLYTDFAVENDLAPVITTDYSVAILSGSSLRPETTSNSYLGLFGRFDTRYTTPRTTAFISQPFGKAEYPLFHFETLDDGAYANQKFKVSIAGLKASVNDKVPWGSFEVQIRVFDDTDTGAAVIERYPNCSLDSNSDRYVARLIGDKKVRFDFDQEDPDERRLVVTGKYPNVSSRVRIVMADGVSMGDVPKNALPFGFQGPPVLKTNDQLKSQSDTAITDFALKDGDETLGSTNARRLAPMSGSADGGLVAGAGLTVLSTTGSIVPPLPYRFKVTRGKVASSPWILGQPGSNERVDGRFYWGVKTTPLSVDSSSDSVLGISDAVLNSNIGAGVNPLVAAYTKFQGIQKLDMLVSGTALDVFNNNKFTLARVALGNSAATLSAAVTAVTGTAKEHMLEAAYVRNGRPDATTYTVTDHTSAGSNRVTLATLVATSSALFNRFTGFAKFTNIFYGGFDGVNILDEDQFYFTDRSVSGDTGGKNVNNTTPDIGLTNNVAGTGRRNNNVTSLKQGIDIITNPVSARINLLAVPGIRDPYVADYAADAAKNYSLAMYVMDMPTYDKDGNRLYDDSANRSDVTRTISEFEGRGIDNNYVATYFPDVRAEDHVNNRIVEMPSSVAAFAALGYNDKTNNVWFAPAGFSRGALDFVRNVENRLSSNDRDSLYDARINPIATFPRAGYVIFGQKTLQVAQTALDRINVRRMMLDVKRRLVGVAKSLLFEQNNAATRALFTSRAVQQLVLVQAGQGIENFKVVCDGTNNTAAEVEQNRMVGQIQVVPTRAVEFIAVDFIITNNSVSFE